jgi:ABC-type siderophore export system fused ATPase/permease subunit
VGRLETVLYYICIITMCFLAYTAMYFVESLGLTGGTRIAVIMLVVLLWTNSIGSLTYYKRMMIILETEATELRKLETRK